VLRIQAHLTEISIQGHVFIDENKILSQIIDNCIIYISSLAKRMYCRMWFLQLNDLSRNVHFEHVGTISL